MTSLRNRLVLNAARKAARRAAEREEKKKADRDSQKLNAHPRASKRLLEASGNGS